MDGSPQNSLSQILAARRIWRVAVAIVLFAVLMAVRHELLSIWARAAIAAVAFALFAWAVLGSRQSQSAMQSLPKQ